MRKGALASRRRRTVVDLSSKFGVGDALLKRTCWQNISQSLPWMSSFNMRRIVTEAARLTNDGATEIRERDGACEQQRRAVGVVT